MPIQIGNDIYETGCFSEGIATSVSVPGGAHAFQESVAHVRDNPAHQSIDTDFAFFALVNASVIESPPSSGFYSARFIAWDAEISPALAGAPWAQLPDFNGGSTNTSGFPLSPNLTQPTNAYITFLSGTTTTESYYQAYPYGNGGFPLPNNDPTVLVSNNLAFRGSASVTFTPATLYTPGQYSVTNSGAFPTTLSGTINIYINIGSNKYLINSLSSGGTWSVASPFTIDSVALLGSNAPFGIIVEMSGIQCDYSNLSYIQYDGTGTPIASGTGLPGYGTNWNSFESDLNPGFTQWTVTPAHTHAEPSLSIAINGTHL